MIYSSFLAQNFRSINVYYTKLYYQVSLFYLEHCRNHFLISLLRVHLFWWKSTFYATCGIKQLCFAKKPCNCIQAIVCMHPCFLHNMELFGEWLIIIVWGWNHREIGSGMLQIWLSVTVWIKTTFNVLCKISCVPVSSSFPLQLLW